MCAHMYVLPYYLIHNCSNLLVIAFLLMRLFFRYIEFDEMQIMAAQLGAPFKSVKEARKTWQQMDTAGTGRVKEEQFVEWWYNKEQDVLRKKLSDQLGFSADKLGKGAKSRGVVFG